MNNFVTAIAFSLLPMGIYLVFQRYIGFCVKSIAAKLERIRNRQQKSKCYLHLVHVFQTISRKNITMKKIEKQICCFLTSSILLFFISFIWLLRWRFTLFSACIASCILAFIPYGCLLLRLKNLQYKGSFEGEIVIAELLNAYKINYYNMIAAIDESQHYLEKAPICRKAFFHLSLDLKTCKTKQEIRQAVESFHRAIHTNWAGMLSNNIYMAVAEEILVLEGLEDVLNNCGHIVELQETLKMESAEGFAMYRFLAPLLIVGLFWMAVQTLSYPLSMILVYQFQTSPGLQFLIGIIGMGFVVHAAASIVSHKKFDF